MDGGMKTCTLCTRTLPLTSFRWQPQRARYESRCKQCEQARARDAWHKRKDAAPVASESEASALHGHADGWRYRPEPGVLAWRV